MIYTTIFIFFIFSIPSAFTSKCTKEVRILFYFIAISFIPLFAILVGLNSDRADYTNYLNYFIEAPKLDGNNLIYSFTHSHYELGYSFFQSCIKTVIDSPTVYFILICFISLDYRKKFYKKTCDKEDLMILFFSFLAHEFLRKDCIQIRNGIASAMVLLGIFYLYRGKKKLFIFNILLACSFHMAAIVALPLIILETKYSSRIYNFYKVIFFLALLISLFLPLRKILTMLSAFGIIPAKLNIYLMWADYLVPMKFTNPFLLKQVAIVMFILVRRKKAIQDDKTFFFFQAYVICTVYYLVFRDLEILAARFGSLFYGVETPLLLCLIKQSNRNVNIKKFYLLLFYFVLFFYNYLTFGNFLGWHAEFY